MEISEFTNSLGVPISDIDALRELADSNSNCVIADTVVEAKSVLVAIENPHGLDFHIRPKPKIASRDALVHEAISEEAVFNIGYVANSGSPLVTFAEEAFCEFILSVHGRTLENDECVFFFTSGFSNEATFNFYETAVLSEKDSTLGSEVQSILVQSPAKHGLALVGRYLTQSYENRFGKYGFLELYRALEAVFLSMILVNLEANFHSDANRALKQASDSLGKERVQLANACSTLGLGDFATRIARSINRLDPVGNNFAKDLHRTFDKDTSTKPYQLQDSEWMGAWYIYQLRCSIAHAGASGIVFEDYGNDATDLIEEVYSDMEKLVFGALGISFNS